MQAGSKPASQAQRVRRTWLRQSTLYAHIQLASRHAIRTGCHHSASGAWHARELQKVRARTVKITYIVAAASTCCACHGAAQRRQSILPALRCQTVTLQARTHICCALPRVLSVRHAIWCGGASGIRAESDARRATPSPYTSGMLGWWEQLCDDVESLLDSRVVTIDTQCACCHD